MIENLVRLTSVGGTRLLWVHQGPLKVYPSWILRMVVDHRHTHLVEPYLGVRGSSEGHWRTSRPTVELTLKSSMGLDLGRSIRWKSQDCESLTPVIIYKWQEPSTIQFLIDYTSLFTDYNSKMYRMYFYRLDQRVQWRISISSWRGVDRYTDFKNVNFE